MRKRCTSRNPFEERDSLAINNISISTGAGTEIGKHIKEKDLGHLKMPKRRLSDQLAGF